MIFLKWSTTSSLCGAPGAVIHWAVHNLVRALGGICAQTYGWER